MQIKKERVGSYQERAEVRNAIEINSNMQEEFLGCVPLRRPVWLAGQMAMPPSVSPADSTTSNNQDVFVCSGWLLSWSTHIADYGVEILR